MSATQFFTPPDSFKSGTSLADLLLGRWSAAGSAGWTPSLNSTGGRFGGQSWRITTSGAGAGDGAYLKKSGIGNRATAALHFPLNISALPGIPIELASFFDSSTQQICLVLNADGTLGIRRGGYTGTVLATSTFVLTFGVYYTYELKVTFATGTGGVVELRMWGPGTGAGGSVIASTSSLNTSASGNAQANSYVMGQINGTAVGSAPFILDYEHFACLDDFIGDKRFYARPPNSNPTAVWTPNASTNLSRVQEAQQDGATTIISSSNPGDQDWYGYTALPAGVKNIFAVIHSAWEYKSDAGARQIRINWKQGSTIAHGAIVNPSTTNAEQIDISYIDPASGIAFVKTDVDTLLNGPELYS